MQQDVLLPFDLPAVARKKVSVAFDGGMLSSDAGVLLLRGVERRLGIAARLAACLTDHRDPTRIDHTLVEMLRLRMFAIAAGPQGKECRHFLSRLAARFAVSRNAGCRTADRIDPARVCGSFYRLRRGASAPDPAKRTLVIIMTLERIGPWTKMRRSLARFNGPASSVHARSLADFITIMCGFRFSVHTPVTSSASRGFPRAVFQSQSAQVVEPLPFSSFC